VIITKERPEWHQGRQAAQKEIAEQEKKAAEEASTEMEGTASQTKRSTRNRNRFNSAGGGC
jgi:hypothetical protein